MLNLFRLAIIYRVLPDAMFFDHIRALRQEVREREAKLVSSRSQSSHQ
jgi:hypothetical protein